MGALVIYVKAVLIILTKCKDHNMLLIWRYSMIDMVSLDSPNNQIIIEIKQGF